MQMRERATMDRQHKGGDREMKKTGQKLIINEIVKRILLTAKPRKIYLFGSEARSESRPDSDIDILIVIRSGGHRRKTAQRIYKSLVGVGYAADIVVVTEDDVERYKENEWMVIKQALEEGVVLYAA